MIARQWWNSRWMLPLAALATAIPLLWPRIPPLADVPGHMASYHVSTMLGQSPELQRFFEFQWQLVGNLGVDLAVVPLTALVGVEWATKLIVIALPVLTALALLLLAREAHGRLPATALAAVPLAYNYTFISGFINYNLAVVLALFGLLGWLRWPSERRPLLRTVIFAALAAAVWLAHAIGWLMLGAMCGAVELRRRLDADGATLAGILHTVTGTAVACAGLGVPVVLNLLGQHANQGNMYGWLWKHELFQAAAGILRDRWFPWDILSAAALGVLIIASFFGLGRLRLTPLLFWPAFGLAVLIVILPMSINGSLYVNTRIIPYAVALGIVAIDTTALTLPRQAVLATAATLFCATRLGGNAVSLYLYDQSYTRELAAVDHLPRGATVLALVAMPCTQGLHGWQRHRLEHLPAIVTVRRDAFTNGLWSIKGLQLLRDRMPQAAPMEADPSEFVYPGDCHPSAKTAFATAPAGVFSYLWLIGVPAADRPSDPRLRPIWSAGDSVLYRMRSGSGHG